MIVGCINRLSHAAHVVDLLCHTTFPHPTFPRGAHRPLCTVDEYGCTYKTKYTKFIECYNSCTATAVYNERDIDFWSSVRMSEFWRTSFDATLASQRAQVGTAAAEGDWRKTVQQYGLAKAEALARG